MRSTPAALLALAAALALAATPAPAGPAVDAPLPQRSDERSQAAARFDNADDDRGVLNFRDMPASPKASVRYVQDAEEPVVAEPEAICRYTTNELVVIYVGLIFAFIPGIVAAHLLC